MTALHKRKSRLCVEFSDTIRDRGKLREVCMEFSPYGVKVKLKGMRNSFDLSPASVYNLAVLKFVAAQKAEKTRKK